MSQQHHCSMQLFSRTNGSTKWSVKAELCSHVTPCKPSKYCQKTLLKLLNVHAVRNLNGLLCNFFIFTPSSLSSTNVWLIYVLFLPLRLIKSLNLVIFKIKKLIDYFISSFTRISIWLKYYYTFFYHSPDLSPRTVSALALWARADMVYSGWDQAFNQKACVIIYISWFWGVERKNDPEDHQLVSQCLLSMRICDPKAWIFLSTPYALGSIRIFCECEGWIEKSVPRSLFGITRLAK